MQVADVRAIRAADGAEGVAYAAGPRPYSTSTLGGGEPSPFDITTRPSRISASAYLIAQPSVTVRRSLTPLDSADNLAEERQSSSEISDNFDLM